MATTITYISVLRADPRDQPFVYADPEIKKRLILE